MTEQAIIDRAIRRVTNYINRNDIYNFSDMIADIRADVQQAMESARREAQRGN